MNIQPIRPHRRLLCLAFVFFAGIMLTPMVRAGLTLQFYIYRADQGRAYVFYTPLMTNDIAPAAPLGSYTVTSPNWPASGSVRQFELTTSGMQDVVFGDSEYSYNSFNEALDEITNGTWTILFTNAVTTNLYTFQVSAAGISSDPIPVTTITFPANGAFILTNQTEFTWTGPTNWPVIGEAFTYDNFYFQGSNPPASQTSWHVDTSIPSGTNYTFLLRWVTNYVTPVLVASTPLSTNLSQPIAGWDTTNAFESGSSITYTVVDSFASPARGHARVADYTFEDNDLFAHDFSESGNDINGYAWFGDPPAIATNDAAAGTYSGSFGGSGWFLTPTNLLSVLEGSFSVSLWLKTTNVAGDDSANQFDATGILSAFGSAPIIPMGQAGHKVMFYTGTSHDNILRSTADVTTAQYVHIVTTRDQQTGEKRIYVNGVLDASVFCDPGPIAGFGANQPELGDNNGHVFAGNLDEVQIYSGVLSSNDVAFLYSHPGTNVADISDVSGLLIGRYDFEDTNAPGLDSAGHHNDANCSSVSGPNVDVAVTNAASGQYAREFFGESSICFETGSAYENLSNTLAGSFSVTAWINTSVFVGSDFDPALFGNPVLFMDGGFASNTAVPLSITGSRAAFTVIDETGNSITLHSATHVNDGQYHFVAVTRLQANGAICLYVDGRLEDTNVSSLATLSVPATITLAGGSFGDYQGLLDDVRVYSGALTAEDVAFLFGQSPANAAFNEALNTVGLPWSTGGDTGWLVERTNSFDSVSAAQSGSVTNFQSSTISVTVTGPGSVSFYWASMAQDPNTGFDYEFDIDDNYVNDIVGNSDWAFTGPYSIPPGEHTLSWTVYANGDTDPNQAGFLDQFVFTPLMPIVLINPQNDGTAFHFQFTTAAGFNHVVQYSTNVASTNWQTYTVIGGDGSQQEISVPLSVFGSSLQGFVRVQTQ
jgi:hypothetical protein